MPHSSGTSNRPWWVSPSPPTIPARVHAQHELRPGQGGVVQHLVVGALEESGIHREYGQVPARAQGRGKGDGVLFRNADVKEPGGTGALELLQAAAVRHGGRDGADALVFFGQMQQRAAERRREVRLARRFADAGLGVENAARRGR